MPVCPVSCPTQFTQDPLSAFIIIVVKSCLTSSAAELINLAMYVFTCGLLLMTLLVVPAMSEERELNGGHPSLLKSLLKNYDKYSRPHPAQEVTRIVVSLPTIYNFELDDTKNTLDILLWLKTEWTDPRLQWNETEFGNITSMGVPQDLIWMPDLTVYNGIDAESHNKRSNVLAVITPNGKVLNVSPMNVRVGCVVDLTYWPHDYHNCEVRIGSWIMDGLKIDYVIDPVDSTTEIEDIPKQKLYDGTTVSTREWHIESWTIIHKSAYYQCCPEPYVHLLLTLELLRDAPAYTDLIQVPTLCLSLLTIIVFLLPPSSPEKVTFGGLNLILNLMFFMFAAHTVAHAPTQTPIIVQLLSQQMVLVVSSLFVAAIVVRVSSGPSTSGRFPNWFQQGLRGVSYALLLRRYRKKEENAHGRTVSSEPKIEECEVQPSQDLLPDSHAHQWLLLGAVLDRLAFIIYLIICIINLYKFWIFLSTRWSSVTD